ncbi:lytic murein transglycosylase [bacterium]|nr:lytic murein transglycosylase [bacterium]
MTLSIHDCRTGRRAGRRTLSALAAVLLALVTVASVQADDSIVEPPSAFDELTNRLIDDGIDPTLVYRMFDDPRAELLPQLLKVNIKQPDATGAYERFKGDASVQDTYRFLVANRATFDSVLASSPVNAEVVAAILKIESDFGSNKGPYPLFNVFATLSLLNSESLETHAPNFWDRILHDLPAEEHDSAINTANRRRSSKANWAYRELKTLIELQQKGQMDPLDERGSWAGAYGIPQFLPSSFMAYAKDGDGDDHIDLDNLSDAIASVANYLAIHRFDAENDKRRRKAVWHYNHSEDYVDAVITLADRVAREEQKSSSN